MTQVRILTAQRMVLQDEGFSISPLTSDGLHVRAGDCLVHATKACKVHFSQLTVEMPVGSVLLVKKTLGWLQLKNLSAKKAIVEVSAQCQTVLDPSQEMIVTQSKDEIETNDGIGRRRIKDTIVAGGAFVRTSEFSIASAIANDRLLKAIRQSTHLEHKKLLASVLKSAAALSIVTANHGPFSTNSN